MIEFIIDGREVRVENGATVLEAARAQAIKIPTLCHHPALKPVGACKLCAVEVPGPSGPTVKLACLLKAVPGLSVRTQSPLVENARRKAFEDLLRLAPNSRRLLELAQEYNVELPPPPDGCLRCRLCIRVCQDIVAAGALRMEKRGHLLFVVGDQNRCLGCGTCANICPTGVITVEDKEGIRTVAIGDRIIGRHNLAACEMCGRSFATERFLERVAHRTIEDHPDVKEHHVYCPTCAKLYSPRAKSATRLRMR